MLEYVFDHFREAILLISILHNFLIMTLKNKEKHLTVSCCYILVKTTLWQRIVSVGDRCLSDDDIHLILARLHCDCEMNSLYKFPNQ